MLTIYLFLAVILSAGAGFFIGRMFFPVRNSAAEAINAEKMNHLQSRVQELQQEVANERASIEKLSRSFASEKEEMLAVRQELAVRLAQKESALENLLEKNLEQKKEVEKLHEKFTKEFEVLANRIMEEKSHRFTEQNKENIKTILTPLQERILHFEKKVEDTHKESIDYHAALRTHIENMKLMNEQMSRETVNLTRALKGDSKMQGNWGELVLERVLAKSGLEKGREYEVQQSHVNEDGSRVFLDVVVMLPDGKRMVIDSKVSLTSYERYCGEDDENLKLQYLREHVSSIRRHVEQLGDKNYHSHYRSESPSFVLLFIPIEPAFAIALNEDPALYTRAFEKNIVIVTPATLLATLRTIDSMWTNQKQHENAMEISRQAAALYDKFEGFVNDLVVVGRKMDDSRKAYDESMKKLVSGRDNLINKVQKLKKLGVSPKKSISQDLLAQAMVPEDEIMDSEAGDEISDT